MYITASSAISHQPTFRNKGFSKSLQPLQTSSSLMEPDYGEFIPAMERRRMTPVIKMSIACTMDCLKQAGIDQPGGIIVGTSMGCCVHTKNFLDKIYSAGQGPLSPTSFIVSTHNTIAGQISLLLKNQGYNMTHTQNSLSFEQSLIDGMLCIQDGLDNILVGGADEEENAIYNTRARLNDETVHLASGAAFFILSNKKSTDESIKLVDIGSYGLVEDKEKSIQEFLTSNQLTTPDLDLILYDNIVLKNIFGDKKLVNYQDLAGTYYTNSAFAMHYGIDAMLTENLRRVLICNNLIPENLGLILLEKTN